MDEVGVKNVENSWNMWENHRKMVVFHGGLVEVFGFIKHGWKIPGLNIFDKWSSFYGHV